jgi:hypothetical protein
MAGCAWSRGAATAVTTRRANLTLSAICQSNIPTRAKSAPLLNAYGNTASDAHACARILLAARQKGHEYHSLLKSYGLKPARK